MLPAMNFIGGAALLLGRPGRGPEPGLLGLLRLGVRPALLHATVPFLGLFGPGLGLLL